MTNKLSSRIVLAWIVLGVAMILLTLSVTFAQSVTLVRKDNGEVHFKYKNTDKKNSQNIDTTFTAKDDAEFYSVLQGISDRNGIHLSVLDNKNKNKSGTKNSFAYSMTIRNDDDEERDNKAEKKISVRKEVRSKRSMQELDEAMKELEASMNEMKLEMRFEDGEDEMDIPAPPQPPSIADRKSSDKEKHIEIIIDNNGKRTKIVKDQENDLMNIPDSLDNADHVIVFGDKNESAPELEKIITNENGKQIFIYKRKKSVKE